MNLKYFMLSLIVHNIGGSSLNILKMPNNLLKLILYTLQLNLIFLVLVIVTLSEFLQSKEQNCQ